MGIVRGGGGPVSFLFTICVVWYGVGVFAVLYVKKFSTKISSEAHPLRIAQITPMRITEITDPATTMTMVMMFIPPEVVGGDGCGSGGVKGA